MPVSAPAGHLVDALELEADGRVELYEIQLVSGTVVRLKNNNTVTYLSNDYEGIALQMTGAGQSADSAKQRPTLTIANPQGAFSPAIDQGQLNKAIVVRRIVLYDDLVNNRAVYTENSWTLSKVTALNKQVASFELRGTGDMAFFVSPNRTFSPPQFPQVSLT